MATSTTYAVKDIHPLIIEKFVTDFKGKIIMPDDVTFETTRNVFNGMIDKYPGMFAICTDATDVKAAINFARENKLRVAIRGGGHNGGGLGLCDDGLVIDLSEIKFV